MRFTLFRKSIKKKLQFKHTVTYFLTRRYYSKKEISFFGILLLGVISIYILFSIIYLLFFTREKILQRRFKTRDVNKEVDITQADIEIIGKILEKNKTADNFNLFLGNLELNNVDSIGKALKTNNTLKVLWLDHNNITDVQSMGEGLEKNNTLKELKLSANKIKDIKSIGKALESNKALTYLDLSYNNITDVESICKGLVINKALTELNLKGNEIGDEGAKAIGEALEVNTSLTEISIQNNNIGNEGGKAIGKALKTNIALTKLNLGDRKSVV